MDLQHLFVCPPPLQRSTVVILLFVLLLLGVRTRVLFFRCVPSSSRGRWLLHRAADYDGRTHLYVVLSVVCARWMSFVGACHLTAASPPPPLPPPPPPPPLSPPTSSRTRRSSDDGEKHVRDDGEKQFH